MKAIKVISLIAAAVFAGLGLFMLLFPDHLLAFFNRISDLWGWPQATMQGAGFYLALAAAYMYLVTLLACLIYRHPGEKWFPFLLANGKLASSAISLFLFVTDAPYLILLANCVVDGLIGLAALGYYFKIRRVS